MAAMLLVSAAVMGISGCSEDRSNLIPTDTSEQMTASLDRIQKLADKGQCFDAKDASSKLLKQVEGLPQGVDADLKRSLTDGVVALTIKTGDPATCTETETIEPDTGTEAETEVTPTGDTGPTTPEDTTTDEPKKEKETDTGKEPEAPTPNPTPKPEPTPTPDPAPNPDPPANEGPGSGGVSPNQ
jgi:hypothetical protein